MSSNKKSKLKNQGLPKKMGARLILKHRPQGQSRADGYYYHRSSAAVGLYWILGAIASMPRVRQIPKVFSPENMKMARPAFIYALCENFRQAVSLRQKQIRAAVRHRETYELLNKIADLKTPEAESDVGDFVKAEAAFSSSLMEFHNDTRCEHLYWLSPTQEQYFRNSARASQFDVSNPFLASHQQRARLLAKYPQQVDYAARQARDFAQHYQLTHKFWFRGCESFNQIRPDYTDPTDLKKVVHSGDILSGDYEWFDLFIDSLQKYYDKDSLAWEKIIFRLEEPQLRLDEFAASKIKKKRPCVGKVYLEWEHAHGRYSGIKDTCHNRLLTDSKSMDRECLGYLDALGLMPTGEDEKLDGPAVIRRLSCFSHSASAGNTLMHLAA